jgi:signal transduction histidine kinase
MVLIVAGNGHGGRLTSARRPYRCDAYLACVNFDRLAWTSQRWLASVLIAMVVLIAAGALVGNETLARATAASDRLSDHVAPARTAVVQLGSALVDQESGVRGYLLTGDEEFLAPYTQGLSGERTAVAAIRTLIGGDRAALADLDMVEREAVRWRAAIADPLVAARRRDAASVPRPLIEQSRTAFDTVRARVAVLDSRLAAMRADARADLTASRRLRAQVFAGLVVALLLLIVLIAVLLRLVVLRPLARLGAAVRQVADGDFGHRLTPEGPADLAALGGDVESMRRRLAESLQASEQQQEELRRSNTDLEQFAYVASHDLQEPLRKVASFCQLLERRYAAELDDRARQYIAFAVDGAGRMQQLINDLLSFSRIGRVFDDRQQVDLSAVVDQVSQNLPLAESGAHISRPELPTVPGDPTLLAMLWQNLLGNAIKFRRPGESPTVEITAERVAAEWHFSVRDNGIGIEPEFADKVFVIFQRLHPREAYAGTGIGLAQCKKIVEFHGGTIRLDEEYREGARMLFTLPARPEPEPVP